MRCKSERGKFLSAMRWNLARLLTGLALMGMASVSWATCDVYFDTETLEIICDGDDDLVDVVGLDGNLFVDVVNNDVIDLIDLGSADDLTDIVIHSGGGDDVVIIIGLDVWNSVDVKTGLGTNRIFAATTIIGNDFKIKMGNGEDLATLAGIDVGNNINIKTGQGDDTVEVLLFPVGNPSETVGIRAGNDIKIDGKQGDDTLTGVSGIDAGNELEINNFE